ncbi:MAG: hypothetical protein DRI87_09825, partial [Bacteroidetes bacterium]
MVQIGKKLSLFTCLFFFLFFFVLQTEIYAEFANNNVYFKYLKKSLIKEGFDKKAINRIYGSKRVYFETKGIYGYLVHSEARVNYKQYVSGKSIYKALKY